MPATIRLPVDWLESSRPFSAKPERIREIPV
jgi:hypothetical protein